jgi:mannitol/fructose-specific phosphotransferase system IIA component (Ntr-type)
MALKGWTVPVNLRQVLDPRTIRLELAGIGKMAIIDELLDLLLKAGKLTDRVEALRAVMEREGKMSTAIQNGVAIPHAKTDAVTELVTAIGLSPKGVDFESLDGKPSHIFIMTLSPKTRLGPHIQFLSSISQSLDDAAIRRALLKAKTPQDVIDLLTA